VPSLISDGKYDYPYVGISSLSEFSLEDQEALNLPRSTGVYILQVIPGGPADQAGLRGAGLTAETPGLEPGGDLIISIDDHEVLTYGDFISYLIKNKSPDDQVVLTVLREGKEIQLDLTLGRRPEP
jgi:2-alkenal reductase